MACQWARSRLRCRRYLTFAYLLTSIDRMRSKNRRLFSLIALIVMAVIFVYGRDQARKQGAGQSVPADMQQRSRTDSSNDERTVGDDDTGKFDICGRERYHCVIDGDTFILDRVHVRMADIDAPEIGGAKCEYERKLGLRAKNRLAELLNEGPFRLEAIDRDVDRYGRKLRVVVRSGHSLGDDLINEGLARKWDGRKKPWC
jgi:micrococcal nuclease